MAAMEPAPTEEAARRALRGSLGSDLETFLEMMSAERGAAPNTLDSYRRDVEDYGSFLARRRTSLRTASPTDIRAYMAELEARSRDLGDPYFCNVTDARGARFVGDVRPTPNGLYQLRMRGDHG